MTSATVTAPIAEATATAVVPRAIYVTGYDPVAFPDAATVSAATVNPTLYVGGDLDHTPYRPPVSAQRGWRVAIAPPMFMQASAATASAATVVPATAISLGSVLIPAAAADSAATDTQPGVSYEVTPSPAVADAATVAPSFGEYRNPYTVDSISTAGIYTIDPVAAASSTVTVSVATSTVGTPSLSSVLAAVPNSTIATATAITPGLSSSSSTSVTAATADAACSAPTPLIEVVTVAQPPTATTTATAVAPTSRTQVKFKAVNTAISTSVAIPAHNAGDLILIWAYQNNASNAPSKPAAGGTVPTWTDITTNPGVGILSSRYAVFRTAYTVATSSSTTTGTWSGADVVMAVVLSGQAASPIGGVGEANATGTITGTTAPAVTMSDTSGTSMLLHFMAFHVATGFLFYNTTPSGYTERYNDNATYSGWQLLTKNNTTTDGAVTSPLSGTGSSGASGGITIEIVAQ